jgi:hypothetical protein
MVPPSPEGDTGGVNPTEGLTRNPAQGAAVYGIDIGKNVFQIVESMPAAESCSERS